MSQKFSFAFGAACIAAVLLAGCGGGGGGGGGGGAGFPIGLPIVLNPVALSGKATYDSVPNNDGPLLYASTTAKPVRGATVEVLDANTSVQLAVTTTDDSGNYTVSVPANTSISVRVRAQLTRTGPGATWDVTVRDNTRGDALYSMQSASFSSGNTALTRDLRADSGWGGSGYTGTRVAAPFAVLDTVYTSMQKVLSVAPASAFPSLKVFWSTDNAPSTSIDLAAGQIGTTFFFNNGSSGRQIYVLGKENVDTDEFDAPVIAHEWGHYYQSAFSRDDSMGGAHDGDDRLDRRLAFSEGWGNAWSGIALNRSNYVDSTGAQQGDGGRLDLSVGPPSGTTPGWFRELSVQAILWNLNRQAGFKPIHDTLTGFQFRGGAPVTSIHAFAAAFKVASPGSTSALTGLLSAQNISSSDAYGAGESNDGGVPSALPMYGALTVGPAPSNACVSNAAGTGNKHGNIAYLRFIAPADREYRVSIGGATVPDFDLFRGGEIARSGNTVSLGAGEYVLAVRDAAMASTPISQKCLTVLVQQQ
ncbi:carboxypeptidase-like regulatory domain-containing protein [Variovorax sp. EBFNA2]|uniref:carboxypeptidase-like regulatory domain-containing protein n=1 Tax=Variovorax sp. EBFNA2 TaxID=3342097 RepID=UPI0029BFD628|nr:carboxypeptidase-like regulatory domain-containing protein [Variovorax boronicumulans]WPG37311.1 carboxypeptidase-like regulatory domain-containing protein [Variovorax boronicumulans]